MMFCAAGDSKTYVNGQQIACANCRLSPHGLCAFAHGMAKGEVMTGATAKKKMDKLIGHECKGKSHICD
jgi:hypothetical protein